MPNYNYHMGDVAAGPHHRSQQLWEWVSPMLATEGHPDGNNKHGAHPPSVQSAGKGTDAHSL